jgi:DNA-binding Lrp family transcriptional regulator
MSGVGLSRELARASMTLDWKIYRELYRQADDPLWGMFPHPPIGEIAEELGVSKVTVWRRLAAMEKSGFLSAMEVLPNPALLGVGLAVYRVDVPDRRARVQFLDELETVDGILSAQLDFGRSALLVAVTDLPASQTRRERLIRRLRGVEQLERIAGCWLPPCPASLPAEAWRFIWAIRQHPRWTLEQLAASLGITRKTASKRYRTLRSQHSILSQYLEDFTKYPGAVIGMLLTLEAGANVRGVLETVRRLYPDALEPPSLRLPPGELRPRPGFIWEVSSPSNAEHSIASVLAAPGVATVESWLPGITRVYPHWVDARMFETMERLGVAPPHPAAAARPSGRGGTRRTVRRAPVVRPRRPARPRAGRSTR